MWYGTDFDRCFFPFVQQIENLKEGNVRFEKRDNSSERGKICSSALIIRDATKGLYKGTSHFCLLSLSTLESRLLKYSRIHVPAKFPFHPSLSFFFFFSLSLCLSKYFSNIDTPLCSFPRDASQRRRRSPSVWIPNGEAYLHMRDRRCRGRSKESWPTASQPRVPSTW